MTDAPERNYERIAGSVCFRGFQTAEPMQLIRAQGKPVDDLAPQIRCVRRLFNKFLPALSTRLGCADSTRATSRSVGPQPPVSAALAASPTP